MTYACSLPFKSPKNVPKFALFITSTAFSRNLEMPLQSAIIHIGSNCIWQNAIENHHNVYLPIDLSAMTWHTTHANPAPTQAAIISNSCFDLDSGSKRNAVWSNSTCAPGKAGVAAAADKGRCVVSVSLRVEIVWKGNCLNLRLVIDIT